MGSESSSATTSKQTTNTVDERVVGADQAVAVRGGGDNSETSISYSIVNSDGQLLRDLAAGLGDLTTNVLSSNSGIATDAMAKISDVQTTGLTDGSANLQKTVLIGLAIGVAAIVALVLWKK